MKFEFNKDADIICTDDFFYDLFVGGYIRPESILTNENQIEELSKAISLVEDFETQLSNYGLMEEV